MSFGGFNQNSQQMGTTSEINMVPLIDVMLVLLIIFMITAPLMAHSIKINVPQVSSTPVDKESVFIDLAIKDNGEIYWDDEQFSLEQLKEQMQLSAQSEEQPKIRIRAASEAKYEWVAQVMGAAKSSGIKSLSFVTSPEAETQSQNNKD